MRVSSQFTEGDIDAVLGAGPAGGWDIVALKVKGREVPATRKGEFETEQEAKDTAIARAKAYAESEGLSLRR
ncbi:hypothetical protein AO073_14500 [Pseudomonas syringae ICMP 11293]|nr:hypothetical protein AO070_04705 [Pseudomonas syringae pv. syringae PD2766]KTB95067.1 hypothetical protein AO073_14500 [Pseudomonas syringae ICMP 11293]